LVLDDALRELAGVPPSSCSTDIGTGNFSDTVALQARMDVAERRRSMSWRELLTEAAKTAFVGVSTKVSDAERVAGASARQFLFNTDGCLTNGERALDERRSALEKSIGALMFVAVTEAMCAANAAANAKLPARFHNRVTQRLQRVSKYPAPSFGRRSLSTGRRRSKTKPPARRRCSSRRSARVRASPTTTSTMTWMTPRTISTPSSRHKQPSRAYHVYIAM